MSLDRRVYAFDEKQTFTKTGRSGLDAMRKHVVLPQRFVVLAYFDGVVSKRAQIPVRSA